MSSVLEADNVEADRRLSPWPRCHKGRGRGHLAEGIGSSTIGEEIDGLEKETILLSIELVD